MFDVYDGSLANNDQYKKPSKNTPGSSECSRDTVKSDLIVTYVTSSFVRYMA